MCIATLCQPCLSLFTFKLSCVFPTFRQEIPPYDSPDNPKGAIRSSRKKHTRRHAPLYRNPHSMLTLNWGNCFPLMCNQEAGRLLTLKNKTRNQLLPSVALPNQHALPSPWPTCLSNLASQGVPEAVTDQEGWILDNGLKYSESLRLPLQVFFKACCSRKVNSLCTCLLSNRWQATTGPVRIPPCSNSWPLVFWDLHCLPQALTDKLIGVLGSTELLRPL